MTTLAELTEPAPPPGRDDWNDTGVVILPGYFSAKELLPYTREWLDGYPDEHDEGGYNWPTPYMECPAMRSLLCNLALSKVLRRLTDETMALNLALTGWRSTERNWHQDSYL